LFSFLFFAPSGVMTKTLGQMLMISSAGAVVGNAG
jgi:hypothetical protein